jgi:hypothetical protein
MKIKQRALVIRLIAVVVIAVVVVAVILLFRGGGGGPGGLTVYPGSKTWNIPAQYRTGLPSGVDYAGYTVDNASVDDVLNWYKDVMTDWELQTELPGTGLVYTKGNDCAYVAAASGDMVGQTGTVYVLVYGQWSILESLVSGLGGRGAPPNALLSVTANKVDANDYTLTISHEGGDDLAIADLEIQASSSATTMTTIAFPGSGTFSVGSQVTTGNIAYSPDVTGQVITVYIIHVPSNEKIFSSSTVVVQG